MSRYKTSYLGTLSAAVNQTFRKRKYLAAFIVLSVALFFAYEYLFSSSAFGILFFGGFYPVFILLVSIIIGPLLSLVLVLNAFSLSNYPRAGKQTGVSSIAAVLSVSFSLCCGTIIPSLLAVFGASTPFLISNNGKIQGLLSTFGVPLVALSIVLLLLSLYLVSRNVCDECKIKR